MATKTLLLDPLECCLVPSYTRCASKFIGFKLLAHCRLAGGSFYVYGANLENAKLMGIKATQRKKNSH